MGGPKKKNKRKLVVDPEEAKRLRQLQMDLMSKIQVHDFPFWHANQDVFFEALDTVKVDKMTLREYYGSEDRLGDILYFPLGKHPHFIEEGFPPQPQNQRRPEAVHQFFAAGADVSHCNRGQQERLQVRRGQDGALPRNKEHLSCQENLGELQVHWVLRCLREWRGAGLHPDLAGDRVCFD